MLGWKDSERRRHPRQGRQEAQRHPLDPQRGSEPRPDARVHARRCFQQAGVEAQIKITDWPSFSTGYVQKSQHQVALLGWLNIIDPDRLMYSQF